MRIVVCVKEVLDPDAVNNYVVDQLSAYICQGMNVIYGRNGDGTKISGTSVNITFVCQQPASGVPNGNNATVDVPGRLTLRASNVVVEAAELEAELFRADRIFKAGVEL